MNKLDPQPILEHIRYLSEEIGPRPAGTAAERQALDYVAGCLESWGYSTERPSAQFTPLPRFSWPFPWVGAWLLAASLALPVAPWLAVFGPLWIGLLPALARLEDHRRPCTQPTGNVYAQKASKPDHPTLIFVAHVDTARVSRFTNRFLLDLYSRTLFISQRIAIFTALLASLVWIGIPIPTLIVTLTRLVAGISAAWFLVSDLVNQFAGSMPYSPGANDNASGTAVSLALAEYLAGEAPPFANIGFLFTGAEETGLHGAEAFAVSLAQRKETDIAVISVDMVGSGPRLYYVAQEGALIARKTNPRLNQSLRDACPEIAPIWYGIKSGDYSPFLTRGIPATGIQRGGNAAVQQRYHSQADTLAGIEPGALSATLDCLIRLTELYSG